MRVRFVFIVVAIVLVIVAFVFMSSEATRRSQFTTRLSSFSAAPEGGRALYSLSQQLGLKPERLMHNLEVLPEKGTIVCVAPRASGASLFSFLFGQSAFTDREVQSVREWVEQGNTFVMIDGGEAKLLKAFGIAADEEFLDPTRSGAHEQDKAPSARKRWPPDVETARPAVAGHQAHPDVRRLEIEASAGGISLMPFDEDTLDHTEGVVGYAPIAVAETGRVVVAEVALGAGHFVVVRSTWPATNAGVGREDNALFMMQLLSRHTGSKDKEAGLWFDEFHHGFSSDRSLAAYLRDTSLWVVVGQLLFLLILVAWRVHRRFGSPLPLYEEEFRGSGDYLKAMSQIYRRGGHAHHVVAVMLDDLSRQAVDCFGLTRGLSGEKLVMQLEQEGHPEISAQLKQLRIDAGSLLSAERIKDSALVLLAQRIARCAESMRVRRL